MCYAASLHQRSELPLLLTGGNPSEAEADSDAEVMQRTLQMQQLSAKWVEPRGRNTAESARYTADMLLPQGLKCIVLVTNAFHMPRSVSQFEQVGFEVVPAPNEVYGPLELSILHFLPTPAGLYNTRFALNEVVGQLWYWWFWRRLSKNAVFWPNSLPSFWPQSSLECPRLLGLGSDRRSKKWRRPMGCFGRPSFGGTETNIGGSPRYLSQPICSRYLFYNLRSASFVGNWLMRENVAGWEPLFGGRTFSHIRFGFLTIVVLAMADLVPLRLLILSQHGLMDVRSHVVQHLFSRPDIENVTTAAKSLASLHPRSDIPCRACRPATARSPAPHPPGAHAH